MYRSLLPFAVLAFTAATLRQDDPRAAQARPASATTPASAVAVLTPIGGSGVEGTLRFERVGEAVHVTGEITGLTPGEHGFHVHEYGDLTDTSAGQSAGNHFSPRGMPHGRPSESERHVGDLGNVTANEAGVARVDLRDEVIEIQGPHSILGRAIVVHESADEFVQPSGDAGGRVAFGVIGIARPDGTGAR